MKSQSRIQPTAQAGSPGKTVGVDDVVGGVHSSEDQWLWTDLFCLKAERRAQLKEQSRRDSACADASQRNRGAGDGSKEITTPQKLQRLQRALYTKAKAQANYRFWSLYHELTRRDLLEHALELVARNGGVAGVDGQSIESIMATPQTRAQWLDAVQKELTDKSYRPSPVRRVYIPKGNGDQRPLGIPTVKDRVVQMALLLVLAPIFEADFHPHSYGFRPRRSAHDALDAISAALESGRLEVVDVDLSKYFDTIPHNRLLGLIARRISDGSVLHLIAGWLRAPVVETNKEGKRRVLPNKQGTPQGGVISPLLANLYLNALDWAVNDPQQRGQPTLIRYADDFVILCGRGQGAGLLERLRGWLSGRGLKLNEEKSRLADSRKGFNFLGFRVRWQRGRKSGGWYAHTEPSPKSQRRYHERVREHLNRWTQWRPTGEIVSELNRFLRGWSGYFHYQHSTRVLGKLNGWTRTRLKRWLWRKHGQKHALWTAYSDDRLQAFYGLWSMPEWAAWKRK